MSVVAPFYLIIGSIKLSFLILINFFLFFFFDLSSQIFITEDEIKSPRYPQRKKICPLVGTAQKIRRVYIPKEKRNRRIWALFGSAAPSCPSEVEC